MPTLGSFQSVIQLAAGLNVGVSGILTLWENPIERERETIARLWNRTSDLHRLYPEATEAHKNDIRSLLRDCRVEIKNLTESKGSLVRFTSEKTIALSGAAAAIASLVYATEYPDLVATMPIRILAYATLAVTPVLIGALAYRVWKMSGTLKTARTNLDKRYVALVNELAEQ